MPFEIALDRVVSTASWSIGAVCFRDLHELMNKLLCLNFGMTSGCAENFRLCKFRFRTTCIFMNLPTMVLIGIDAQSKTIETSEICWTWVVLL